MEENKTKDKINVQGEIKLKNWVFLHKCTVKKLQCFLDLF